MMLNPSELATIEAAVRAAELRTRGEIYCVAAEQSSDYGETPLAWAAGVALLAPALLLLLGLEVAIPDLFGGGWMAAQGDIGSADRALVAAIALQAALFAATALIVSIPAVRLLLTPGGLKRDRVRRRAEEQFLSKSLHLTRERTGVLIFVSFAEHRAELIADDGIAMHVKPEVWDHAIAALTAELKAGRPAKGFEAAVGLCADVLAEHFPADPNDNPNELPDAVVVLPRA